MQMTPDGRPLGNRFVPFKAPMGRGYFCNVNQRTCHKKFPSQVGGCMPVYEGGGGGACAGLWHLHHPPHISGVCIHR